METTTEGATALAELKMFARSCMKTMRDRIEGGGEVMTMAFLLRPDDVIVATPVNTPSANDRAVILRALVEATHARAVLLVTDAWIKDPNDHNVRTGEMLSAVLVTRDDPDNGVGFMQIYKRNPFVWEDVKESDRVNFAYDIFPRTTTH